MSLPTQNPEAQKWRGQIVKGPDGQEYVSALGPDGKYKWRKYQIADKCATPLVYYRQFGPVPIKYNIPLMRLHLKVIAGILRRHGIYLLPAPWKSVWNFSDFLWDYAYEKIREILPAVDTSDWDKMRDLPMIMYSEDLLFSAGRLGTLYLQHNLRHKEHREKVIEVLHNHFGKHFHWNGSPRAAIAIKMSPASKPSLGHALKKKG